MHSIIKYTTKWSRSNEKDVCQKFHCLVKIDTYLIIYKNVLTKISFNMYCNLLHIQDTYIYFIICMGGGGFQIYINHVNLSK